MAKGNGQVTRDSIRSALFGAHTPQATRIVTIGDGVDVEVREPTVGIRNRILKAAGFTAANQDVEDIGGMQLAAVVECTYLPGGSERIFDWEDRDTIQNLPTSSWFDTLAAAALEIMNSEPAKAGKPSRKTRKGSTSSTSPQNSEKQLGS